MVFVPDVVKPAKPGSACAVQENVAPGVDELRDTAAEEVPEQMV